MDRFEALYSFWSSFGIPAYESGSVPDAESVVFPYLTYDVMSSPFDGEVVANASIWTRSTSWVTADAFSDAIERRLENGGAILEYAGGIVWITPEVPFSQSMGDPADDLIKRKLLTVQLHFF